MHGTAAVAAGPDPGELIIVCHKSAFNCLVKPHTHARTCICMRTYSAPWAAVACRLGMSLAAPPVGVCVCVCVRAFTDNICAFFFVADSVKWSAKSEPFDNN